MLLLLLLSSLSAIYPLIILFHSGEEECTLAAGQGQGQGDLHSVLQETSLMRVQRNRDDEFEYITPIPG